MRYGTGPMDHVDPKQWREEASDAKTRMNLDTRWSPSIDGNGFCELTRNTAEGVTIGLEMPGRGRMALLQLAKQIDSACGRLDEAA